MPKIPLDALLLPRSNASPLLVAQFNSTVWSFYEQLKGDGPLLDVLYRISAKRGENNEEQQGEGEAKASIAGSVASCLMLLCAMFCYRFAPAFCTISQPPLLITSLLT